MNPHKKVWTLLLISTSILLLLVLQILWLRSAFTDELEGVKKETNYLFRNTIIALQDSLILKGLKPLDSSTLQFAPQGKMIQVWNSRVSARDTLISRVAEPRPPQMVMVRDSTTKIQIYVSSVIAGDSAKNVLRPIVSEIRRKGPAGNFVISRGSRCVIGVAT